DAARATRPAPRHAAAGAGGETTGRDRVAAADARAGSDRSARSGDLARGHRRDRRVAARGGPWDHLPVLQGPTVRPGRWTGSAGLGQERARVRGELPVGPALDVGLQRGPGLVLVAAGEVVLAEEVPGRGVAAGIELHGPLVV